MKFHIEWHNRIDSTNTYIHDRISKRETVDHGFIVAAREQTLGRGRQNRKWLSAPDTNLCFSLFLKTDAELIKIPSLTMAAALAITESLNNEKIAATPKWPNDVLVNGKKNLRHPL